VSDSDHGAVIWCVTQRVGHALIHQDTAERPLATSNEYVWLHRLASGVVCSILRLVPGNGQVICANGCSSAVPCLDMPGPKPESNHTTWIANISQSFLPLIWINAEVAFSNGRPRISFSFSRTGTQLHYFVRTNLDCTGRHIRFRCKVLRRSSLRR